MTKLKYNSVTVSKAEIPFVVMLCYRKGDFSGLQSCVCCVEPNDDMRRVVIEELQSYEKFHAVKETATATTLEDKSVDFVATAQAFHWFDTVDFQQVCRRILKPGGLVFLIWNMRDM